MLFLTQEMPFLPICLGRCNVAWWFQTRALEADKSRFTAQLYFPVAGPWVS